MKRIIYFGDFIEKHSTERYITYAFNQLGYEVMTLQEGRTPINDVNATLQDIKDYEPEFILFSKGSICGKADELIKRLKEEGIKTVCWLFDLYFGLPGNRVESLKSKKCPYNAEVLVTTDGGHEQEFKELGFNHKCVRQGIHEPEAILYEIPLIHDIVFVGGDFFKNRGWLLEGLKKQYGNKFERFGFPYPVVRNLPLNQLYSSTKIVVGDSQPSPNYWSNRIYETLGRGGFLIHPDVQGLDKEFKNGVHLVTYKRGDTKQLFKLIDYYLKHDEEREKIRRAGFEHVKNNFTYTKRVEELLKQI